VTVSRRDRDVKKNHLRPSRDRDVRDRDYNPCSYTDNLYNEQQTDLVKINRGVLHGSVLGPVKYTANSEDIVDVVDQHRLSCTCTPMILSCMTNVKLMMYHVCEIRCQSVSHDDAPHDGCNETVIRRKLSGLGQNQT